MKRVTLYLDEQVWRRWRLACFQRQTPDQKVSASHEVERLIREQLARWDTEKDEDIGEEFCEHCQVEVMFCTCEEPQR